MQALSTNGLMGSPWGMPLNGIIGVAISLPTTQILGALQAWLRVASILGFAPRDCSAVSATSGHKWLKAFDKSVSAMCSGSNAKKDAVAWTTEVLAFPHHWSAGGGGKTFKRALCQTRTRMLATLMGLDSLGTFLGIPTTFQDQSRAESSGQGSGLLWQNSVVAHQRS